MKLNKILPVKDEKIIGNTDIEISDIFYDSRKVVKNSLFFALPGQNTDGKKFVFDAIKNGAIAIVSNEKIEDVNTNITQIIVDDVFSYMSDFSAKFFNHPDRDLKIIAITGTNGKTTITYMIESILKSLNIDCAVMGTINYRYKDVSIEAPNTTPQSLDVYKIMRNVVDAKVKYLVMEVSSHALALGRVRGIDFDIAIFTNLTQDHLDFHKTLENYFKAKAILFESLKKKDENDEKFAIVNIDDVYGKKLLKINENCPKITYSIKNENSDLKATSVVIRSTGSRFDLVYKDKIVHNIEIEHVGLHNIYNALASIAGVLCLKINFGDILNALKELKQAPGRLEKIDTKDFNFEVVVDFAHTDDALKNVLNALKKIKPKRIITVFGCGGQRDRTKRPVMGETAVKMSDFVFVTSDNPRLENPKDILLDIEVGIKRCGKKNYKVIENREIAIKEAVMMAEKDDIVLLAGKGHETYQIIGTTKYHFNDTEIAQKYLNERRKKTLEAKKISQKEFDF